jgi:hypothetical protein
MTIASRELTLIGQALPALFTSNQDAARRFVEFFTANIRNPNTRKAYARAAAEFVACWVQTFAKMADDGYSFSLSALAFTEFAHDLVSQAATGRCR